MAINSLSASSKGFSGLVSGMNTEDIVKKMLTGTQAKITKQNQNKAVLGYKQEAYRDVLSSIKTLQSNYFSFGSNSSTNLLSSSFFNTMAANTKSNAYKVTGTPSASAGKVTVNEIKQLAQSLKLQSNTKASGKIEGKLEMSALQKETEIQVRLDGVLKSIKIAPVDSTLSVPDQQAALAKQLQQGIDKAFGNGITVSVSSGTISFTPGDISRDVVIAGGQDTMKIFGMTSGISNKVNSNQSLKDINFGNTLTGTEFKFSINGVDFTFNENQSLNEVISTVNSSNANVKIRYSSLEDTFSIESTVSGAGTSIQLKQTEGNLLSNMFGIAGENAIGRELYYTDKLDAGKLKAAAADTTLATMGYGDSNPLKMTIGSQVLSFDGSKKLSEVASDMEATLKNAVTAGGGDASSVSVQLSTEKPPRFKVCGVPIPLKISIVPADNALFASSEVTVGDKVSTIDASSAMKVETAGQNAVMMVNNQRVERNSNDFTIDGLAFQLNSTTSESSDIEVTRNTDKIYDGVVKFMEDYNKLNDKIWGLLKQEPKYREYPPLTDEQKKELTDKEIELWEEKAKEGLLRGDQTLEGIVNAMRTSLVSKPDGSKYSLADIGISTSYDFEKGYGGKLVFSDGSQSGTKLKELIANDPSAIEKLFTGENGIMVQMNQVLTAVSKASLPTDKFAHLSLVDVSGTKGMPDTSSKIYKQMREIDRNLNSLKKKYETEHKRYWKQFNAMEKAIAKLNQQSSWLSQQQS